MNAFSLLLMRARSLRRSSLGFLLIEHLIALALVGIVLTGLIQALGGSLVGAARLGDRSSLLHLAQSEFESIKSQTYQPTVSNYTKISAPAGFSITITGTDIVSFQYPSPNVTAAPSTVQLITVTVTSPNDTIDVIGYKVRR